MTGVITFMLFLQDLSISLSMRAMSAARNQKIPLPDPPILISGKDRKGNKHSSTTCCIPTVLRNKNSFTHQKTSLLVSTLSCHRHLFFFN